MMGSKGEVPGILVRLVMELDALGIWLWIERGYFPFLASGGGG
jgi:hypothetical protein